MQIQKTLQSMCWNVKKLTSSQLVKKTPRENEKKQKKERSCFNSRPGLEQGN